MWWVGPIQRHGSVSLARKKVVFICSCASCFDIQYFASIWRSTVGGLLNASRHFTLWKFWFGPVGWNGNSFSQGCSGVVLVRLSTTTTQHLCWLVDIVILCRQWCRMSKVVIKMIILQKFTSCSTEQICNTFTKPRIWGAMVCWGFPFCQQMCEKIMVRRVMSLGGWRSLKVF